MKKFLCLALSFLMLFVFVSCGAEGDSGKKGLLSSFTSETLDGEKVDESIWAGKKVTMINIWATFCGPCIREMPDIQRIHEDYADKGFQVVGIVCDVYEYGGVFDEKGLSTARDIVKETGVKYVNLLPSADLNKARLNSVTSVPETIFVDQAGEIIAGPFIGSRSYESWAGIVEEILENNP